MTEKENKFTTEIPQDQLELLSRRDCSPEELAETRNFFSDNDIFDTAKTLGGSGLWLATQMRLHDYGESTDEVGIKFNDKKENPLWLALEAIATLQNQLKKH